MANEHGETPEEKCLEAPCPRCGKEVFYTFQYCPFCGLAVEMRVESVPEERIKIDGNGKELSDNQKRILAEFDRQFEELKNRSGSGKVKRRATMFEPTPVNIALIMGTVFLLLVMIYYASTKMSHFFVNK